MNDAEKKQMQTLRRKFESLDCAVTEVDDGVFDVLSAEFPVHTHVEATGYYLQFSTILRVVGQGFMPNSEKKLFAFLAHANGASRISKYSVFDGLESDGDGWHVIAVARLVTGEEGLDYSQHALMNILTLWSQDLAEVIKNRGAVTVTAMMEK